MRSSGFWWNEDAIELGCSIYDGSGGNAPRVGVRARRRLEIGEVLVRIPTSACLTSVNCKHSASVLEAQKSLGEKEWLAVLGFALLLERGGGGGGSDTSSSCSSSSRWAPYLAVLPVSESNVVMMWSDEQRRYLAGTDVEQALRDERAHARVEWEGHIKPIVAKLEGADKRESAYTFEQYLAARSVVSSRAFTINPVVGVGLVPIADLFNHRTGGHHVHLTDLDDKLAIPEITRKTPPPAKEGVARPSSGESDCMFMKIVRPVNEGEEVFNTYGELGNAKLLCSYGFAQMDNPADLVTIGLPALRAAAALRGVSGAQIAARLAWCVVNGVCDDETTFHLKARSVPSDALLLVLWILATTDRQFDAVRKAMEPLSDEKGNETSSSSSSMKTETISHIASIAASQGGLKEKKSLQILSETLRRRMALYAGAPADDGDSIWKSNISILLNSEKEIIRSCEQYLRSELHLEENVMIDNGGIGENRKRKVDGGSSDEGAPKAPQDAFSLFD